MQPNSTLSTQAYKVKNKFKKNCFTPDINSLCFILTLRGFSGEVCRSSITRERRPNWCKRRPRLRSVYCRAQKPARVHHVCVCAAWEHLTKSITNNCNIWVKTDRKTRFLTQISYMIFCDAACWSWGRKHGTNLLTFKDVHLNQRRCTRLTRLQLSSCGWRRWPWCLHRCLSV